MRRVVFAQVRLAAAKRHAKKITSKRNFGSPLQQGCLLALPGTDAIRLDRGRIVQVEMHRRHMSSELSNCHFDTPAPKDPRGLASDDPRFYQLFITPC